MACDSVLRGWFNTVDHENFNRCLSRYEFQPELLFRGIEVDQSTCIGSEQGYSGPRQESGGPSDVR